MYNDVCVFGGCSIDQTFYADDNGNYSELPNVSVPGGKGSNQAVAASRAGANVTIITRLGKDQIGYEIVKNLIDNQVHVNNAELIENLNNDVAQIYIDKDTKDNHIKRITGAIDSFTPDMIEKYKDVLLNSKIVVAQMKIPKEVSVALIEFCYDNSIPIIITPCRPNKLSIDESGNKELIDKITFITCNKSECQTIFGTDNIEECVKAYPNKLIVTLGADGLIYNNGVETIHLPAIKVKNIEDTTGAGDTFNGNLAALLASGESLHNAIYKAQFASALKLQKKTAQAGMPYKDEREAFIREYNLSNHDYFPEFNTAYDAVVEASDALKKKLNLEIHEKKDETFVTDSDVMVEKLITSRILEKFPNDNFVTEELNPENTINGRTWIIDPIDGTAHYMKKSIYWGVQVAFIDNNEVKFSIIYIPKLNEMYYALKGKGAYMNDIKISLDNYTMHESIIEFCGSMHKCLDSKKKIFDKLILNEIKPANFMHINSCCYAFANLLSNRTNVMILSTKKPWDILPGVFMTEELGIKKYSFNDLTIFSNSREFDAFIKNTF